MINRFMKNIYKFSENITNFHYLDFFEKIINEFIKDVQIHLNSSKNSFDLISEFILIYQQIQLKFS